jgi:CubicO group peptidase (beta-lactamase class C family)
VLAEGRYDAENEILSVSMPNRGGTFDFRRLAKNETSDFYPRGRPTVPYAYAPPPALDDGWPVALLDEVGISRRSMEKFIQKIIDTPIDSADSQEDHGVLIARHGKLVLEEYFHGENREKPHDTRSASKSVASDLTGAAIYAGAPVSPSSFVYKVMNGGQFPPGLEPRKRMLTVEHLLTMSSGFDCDENDEKSPGYEDNVWEQTQQPDFYKFTMDLKLIRDPGEKAVYCSANANLTGGVVARAAGQSALALFQKLVAEPLHIARYYLPVTPTGDYYLGGGARFLPRDFMKLGQVHLNGGTWKGHRIYTAEWSHRATAHHVDIGSSQYGYLWWLKDYPYKGYTVHAYFAAGNGGQIVMVIPELDLVMAFYAGSYNSPGGRMAQNVYVPQYILPAVDADR